MGTVLLSPFNIFFFRSIINSAAGSKRIVTLSTLQRKGGGYSLRGEGMIRVDELPTHELNGIQ